MTPYDMLTRAFAKIDARSVEVEARRAWYTGNHPCEFTTTAWDKTFAAKMRSLVENQCGKVVDKRSGPLLPAAFTARDAGPVAEANALWVTQRINDDAEKTRKAIRAAKWSGTQSIVLVDYDHTGEPTQYVLDPANAYAEVSSSGKVQWLVFLWRNAEDYIQATVITDTERLWLETHAKVGRPAAGEFQVKDTKPNPLGYVNAVVYNEGASIIDEIWPLNSALNTAHQVAHVLSNTAANPTTIWWGLQVLDKSGQVTGPKPNINPATGAADVTIPIGADETGTARRVERLESRSPKEWEEIKAGHRSAIWSLASLPASLVDFGGQHPAEGSIEASSVLFADVVREDRQVYDGPHSELASMLVDLRMLKLNQPPVRQRFAVKYANAVTTTETSKVTRFKTLCDAGVSIKDAAIIALDMTPEAAEELQVNAEASKERAVALAGQQFLAGV